ncbi:hypothetical protein Tco_1174868 [Tanacetum coccineum]
MMDLCFALSSLNTLNPFGPQKRISKDLKRSSKISYACSDSLLLTSLCCDDIHEVMPRVSALGGCDNTIMVEGLESTGGNLLGIVMDVYVFVGSFTYITDFVVIEDIREFIVFSIWEALGGNTRNLDSIWEETGQDYNFTRSGFKNARTVPGDDAAIPSDAVRTYKRRRQKLCDGVSSLSMRLQPISILDSVFTLADVNRSDINISAVLCIQMIRQQRQASAVEVVDHLLQIQVVFTPPDYLNADMVVGDYECVIFDKRSLGVHRSFI